MDWPYLYRFAMITRALPTHHRAVLTILLAASAFGGLLPFFSSALAATPPPDPEVVPMKLLRVTFRDMEKKDAGRPVIKMPHFSFTGGGSTFLPVVLGDFTVQGPGGVIVVAPQEATSVEGAMGTRDIALSGPCSVTINATWTPSQDGEFRVGCLINRGTNQIGFQGVVEGEEDTPVPFTATKNFTNPVLGFRTGDSGEEYYFSAEFETGSEGGYVRGWVDIVYSLDLQPIRVDTLEDVVDDDFSEGKQSLREALQRAGNKDHPKDIPILVSGTIELEDGPLVTSGENPNLISLIPLDGSVTLDGGGNNRILVIRPGHQIAAYALTFTRGEAVGGPSGGAPGAPAEGGAILNMGSLELHHCMLNNNGASLGGGAISTKLEEESSPPSTTLLRDCLFDRNATDDEGRGGALLIRQGASLVAVNTVVMRSASAIHNMGALDLRHCTMFFGSHLVTGTHNSTTKLGHCIISGGFSVGSSQFLDLRLVDDAQLESLGYNAIANLPVSDINLFTETDLINIDPGVRLTSDGDGIFLSAFSPCVDSGDPEFFGGDFTPSLATDILGNARRSAGGTIDRGAMEVSALALMLADILRDHAPNADMNLNGIPDLVDVLSGLSPEERHENPPLQMTPHSGAVPAAPPEGEGNATAAPLPPPSAFALIETRVDERIVDGEVTLQTSPDLITWTDRVTYIPNGPESGYTRVLPIDFPENDIAFQTEQKTGFCHLIREAIPVPASGRLFTRLKGTQYGVE